MPATTALPAIGTLSAAVRSMPSRLTSAVAKASASPASTKAPIVAASRSRSRSEPARSASHPERDVAAAGEPRQRHGGAARLLEAEHGERLAGREEGPGADRDPAGGDGEDHRAGELVGLLGGAHRRRD